jgi:hypothetical protein
VAFLVAALALIAADSGSGRPLRDHVSRIEVNHVVSATTGDVHLDQVIYWDRTRDNSQFVVRAWRSLKSFSQVPYRVSKRGQVGGQFESHFHDHRDGVRRHVTADSFIETWTDFDPEVSNQEILDRNLRRDLTQKNPRDHVNDPREWPTLFLEGSAMEVVAEEWRPVLGFEATHEVSNTGVVRFIGGMRVGRGRPYYQPPRFVTVGRHRDGYHVVNIGRRKRLVHNLVLEAFVCPRPPGLQTCHNNGDCTDNRLENLRWDTPKANCQDRGKHGTVARGERGGKAKLTEDQVREILLSSDGTAVFARRFGVAYQSIYLIRKGRNWSHFTSQLKRSESANA